MMTPGTTDRRCISPLAAVLAGLLGAALLTGCSVQNSRSAESDQFGNLGSQACIKNNSSTTFNVAFTTFDTKRGDGTLAPGSEACGEGTTFWGEDVRGSITEPVSNTALGFFASNQWAGAPWFQIALTSDAFRGGICPGEGWSVGDSATMKTDALDFTVTRQGDNSRPGGEWKNFDIQITNGGGMSYPDKYCDKV